MLLLAVTQFTTSSTAPNFRSSIAPAWARGLFSAYIAAFITVWVYKFCVSRDLTIKLPKEVPGAIAQELPRHHPLRRRRHHLRHHRCRRAQPHGRSVLRAAYQTAFPALHRCRNLSHALSLSRQPPRSSGSSASTAPRSSSRASTPSVLPTRPRTCRVLLAGGHPAHSPHL